MGNAWCLSVGPGAPAAGLDSPTSKTSCATRYTDHDLSVPCPMRLTKSGCCTIAATSAGFAVLPLDHHHFWRSVERPRPPRLLPLRRQTWSRRPGADHHRCQSGSCHRTRSDDLPARRLAGAFLSNGMTAGVTAGRTGPILRRGWRGSARPPCGRRTAWTTASRSHCCAAWWPVLPPLCFCSHGKPIATMLELSRLSGSPGGAGQGSGAGGSRGTPADSAFHAAGGDGPLLAGLQEQVPRTRASEQSGRGLRC